MLLSGVRFLGRIRIYQASCLLLFTTPPWPPVSSYPRNLLGFALPVTLEALPASVGPGLPLLVVAAVAAVCTAVRGVQLTRTDLLRRS